MPEVRFRIELREVSGKPLSQAEIARFSKELKDAGLPNHQDAMAFDSGEAGLLPELVAYVKDLSPVLTAVAVCIANRLGHGSKVIIKSNGKRRTSIELHGNCSKEKIRSALLAILALHGDQVPAAKTATASRDGTRQASQSSGAELSSLTDQRGSSSRRPGSAKGSTSTATGGTKGRKGGLR